MESVLERLRSEGRGGSGVLVPGSSRLRLSVGEGDMTENGELFVLFGEGGLELGEGVSVL